jgi:hypothetical protein
MSVSYRLNPDIKARKNWGYWDGVSARKRGQHAPWVPCGRTIDHPFDKAYGKAYWLGYYGEAHPNTGKIPAEVA